MANETEKKNENMKEPEEPIPIHESIKNSTKNTKDSSKNTKEDGEEKQSKKSFFEQFLEFQKLTSISLLQLFIFTSFFTGFLMWKTFGQSNGDVVDSATFINTIRTEKKSIEAIQVFQIENKP
eukprot:CAMPEP_0116895654 /NCGR_PEP_ID=MMETSP0467-20121206/5122_1 /TAXON_ID=283647 /ORGANISM="Mesodinium pulex, Strain SPMC105" /LENGTH=122 /DNA_ID=CAMNT_0004566489 /DNA_START=356 /DNA_END=724 /DNA_ORIENTATION=+